MKSKKSILPKLIFFVIISIAVVIITMSLGDIRTTLGYISNANPTWLIATLLVILVYIFLNQLPIYVLGRADCKDIKFVDSLLIGTTEYFFNGITPFASGGQPFQVYAFNQVGVKPSKSTGILLVNYVCYQASIVIMCLVSLIYFPRVYGAVAGLQVLVIVGIIINVIVLLVFLGLGLSKTARNILECIVYWFLSWKIFKGKFESKKQVFANYCEEVQSSFKHMIKYKGRFIVSILLKILSMIVYFSIPFFLFRALNLNVLVREIPFICAMTTFAVAMTCFIPTPGASGGIEIAFNSLFSSISGVGELALPGMILWRAFTYYLLMLISFIIYLLFNKRASRKAKLISGVEMGKGDEAFEETSEENQSK